VSTGATSKSSPFWEIYSKYQEFFAGFAALAEEATWSVSHSAHWFVQKQVEGKPCILSESPLHIQARLRGKWVNLLVASKDFFEPTTSHFCASATQVVYFNIDDTERPIRVSPTFAVHFDHDDEKQLYHPVFHMQFSRENYNTELFGQVERFRDGYVVDPQLLAGQKGLEYLRLPTPQMDAISTLLMICANFEQGVTLKEEYRERFDKLLRISMEMNISSKHHETLLGRVSGGFGTHSWYLGHGS
jgi:hypothetical protein